MKSEKMGVDEGREALRRKKCTRGWLRGGGGLCLQWRRENRKEERLIPFGCSPVYHIGEWESLVCTTYLLKGGNHFSLLDSMYMTFLK